VIAARSPNAAGSVALERITARLIAVIERFSLRKTAGMVGSGAAARGEGTSPSLRRPAALLGESANWEYAHTNVYGP
jgi:hypothetical protein